MTAVICVIPAMSIFAITGAYENSDSETRKFIDRCLNDVNPMPHIPGSEVMGIAMEDGKSIKKGDRVIIYNRIEDYWVHRRHPEGFIRTAIPYGCQAF